MLPVQQVLRRKPRKHLPFPKQAGTIAALEEIRTFCNFLRLADDLSSRMDVAFLLALGHGCQEVAGAGLGQVFTGLMHILEYGTWSGGKLCWDDEQAVAVDYQAAEAVREQMTGLSAEQQPPWALIWQAAGDSHPHLITHDYAFDEAVCRLAYVLLEETQEEINIHFPMALPIRVNAPPPSPLRLFHPAK